MLRVIKDFSNGAKIRLLLIKLRSNNPQDWFRREVGEEVILANCNVPRHITSLMCRAWLCEVNLPYLFSEPS